MAITATECARCKKTIETEHTAGEEARSDEHCTDCELILNLTKMLGKIVKTLEDKLPGNPDADLQALVAQSKTYAQVVDELDRLANETMAGTQDEFKGMAPVLTTPEIRAQELAAAQDQKDVVNERVKERESTLRYALKEHDMHNVTIMDMTGIKRTFRLEELERIKTKKGGSN